MDDETSALLTLLPDSGCWTWDGEVDDQQIAWHAGRRVDWILWEEQWGPIPEHRSLCRNWGACPRVGECCVNPAHQAITVAMGNADYEIQTLRGYRTWAEYHRAQMHTRWSRIPPTEHQRIYQRYQHGERVIDLADEYAVTRMTIYNIIHRFPDGVYLYAPK